MSANTFSEDLARAFSAGTPLVFTDTAEEERLHEFAERVAQQQRAQLLTWKCTDGLRVVSKSGTAELVAPRKDVPDLTGLITQLIQLTHAQAGPLKSHTMVIAFDAVGEVPSESGQAGLLQSRLTKDLYLLWERTSAGMPCRTLLLMGSGWSVPAALGGFVQTIALPLPTFEETREIFSRPDEGFSVPGDPAQLAKRAVGLPQLTIQNLVRRCSGIPTLGGPDGVGQAEKVIEDVKREEIRRTGILEIVDVPERVELGGFANFKRWFSARREFLLRSGRATMAPRGVLFLGFPGCGKSHAARWIAKELRLPLVAMDIGRVQDRWVGSSEARMRSALRTLEAVAPVVLFIDEIEKGLAGAGTDSSGVTTRLSGQLLTWLSDHRLPVFVVATCNEASIKPELMRAGRIDARFLVQLPDEQERRAIAAAAARELGLEKLDEVTLATLVEISDGFSGAEIRQLLVEAAYRAGFDACKVSADNLRQSAEFVTPLSKTAKGSKLAEDYQNSEGFLLA